VGKKRELLQPKKRKLKICANHTATLCQPGVTQQCERKLASSSSIESSGVVPMIVQVTYWKLLPHSLTHASN